MPSSGFNSGASGGNGSHRIDPRGAARVRKSSTSPRWIGARSQTIHRFGDTYRSQRLRNATQSTAFSAWSCTLASRPPPGVRPLMTARGSRVGKTRRSGVCPRGPEVRTAPGRRETPDSAPQISRRRARSARFASRARPRPAPARSRPHPAAWLRPGAFAVSLPVASGAASHGPCES
jgi:hypothetical protein